MKNSKKGATLVIILITALAVALMLVATISTVSRYYYPIISREETLRKKVNPDYKTKAEILAEKELEENGISE